MPQPKPVKYPNIVDQIRSTVDAHAALHDAVETHVQEHHKALDDKRKQLHVSHVAKALIEKDGKP